MTEKPVPLVSVVMPVYSGEKYVADAIESILGQTFSDFELIIVEDGSQDGSLEIIRSYEACDDRIRLVSFKRNLGAPIARNHAINLSSADYIAMMDCDDVCLPQRLERQVEHLRANQAIGVLGAGAQAVNEDLSPLFLFDLPEHHALIVFNVFVGSFFVHPTVMMRRQLLDIVGGYKPSQRAADDTELWTRLIWRTRFANLSETLLLYRRHEAQHHTSPDATSTTESWDVRARLLQRLWGTAPHATLARFERMRKDAKLGWRERRAARQDMTRLMDAMISAGIIDPGDRGLVSAHIRRRLESTTPRLWQMLLHWRRHHFGPGKTLRAN
ncbi:MAG: glycosyltransferase family 2 protein [Chloroflexi bacterium]|nr:glycosyltransferase family 2 protein [Chloroflexota bacterium]